MCDIIATLQKGDDVMNYFAVEYGENYKDHVVITDAEGNVAFENYLSLSYDEMKTQEDLDEFVIAIMDAATDGEDNTIVTLIGEDDVFIWSIIMGIVDDEIRYNLVNWQKDGKKYRYEI
jgi:hypothetical protein